MTFKRGLMGIADLHEWLDDVHMGSQQPFKSVTISLAGEARKGVVQWRLSSARLLKYAGSSFNAKGNDLAIEELVLSAESIEHEAAA